MYYSVINQAFVVLRLLVVSVVSIILFGFKGSLRTNETLMMYGNEWERRLQPVASICVSLQIVINLFLSHEQ